MKRIIQFVAAAAAVSLAANATAQDASETGIVIGPSANQEYSRTTIDYETWSMMLSEIVLNVGLSDRRSPRALTGMNTGTRISTGNRSRFRFEANRVIYHLVEDFHMEAIQEYRRELEQLPERVNITRLHPDEQLAYWLNLYTVATIEQVGLLYPLSNMERVNAFGTDTRLYDAPVVTILGNELSLNDIQYGIVYQNWDDPRVIYGFFNGTIGSPRVMRRAYDPDIVWQQLENNAREFVNSLRGVDNSPNRLTVSRHYERAAEFFFPEFENDLRSHLRLFAGDDVMELLDADIPLRATTDEWGIADMTNGSNRCGGAISQVSSNGRDSMFCGGLPDNARVLMNYVIDRRIRQIENGTLGNVIITDLPDRNIVIDLDEPVDEDDDTDNTN